MNGFMGIPGTEPPNFQKQNQNICMSLNLEPTEPQRAIVMVKLADDALDELKVM